MLLEVKRADCRRTSDLVADRASLLTVNEIVVRQAAVAGMQDKHMVAPRATSW